MQDEPEGICREVRVRFGRRFGGVTPELFFPKRFLDFTNQCVFNVVLRQLGLRLCGADHPIESTTASATKSNRH
jgi:hypothetical protein